MDVSKIVELVNALEDTWFADIFYAVGIGFMGLFIYSFFKSVSSFALSFGDYELRRNLAHYIEFSLLRDFPDYVKTENSAKWLEKVRLWFIRNS